MDSFFYDSNENEIDPKYPSLVITGRSDKYIEFNIINDYPSQRAMILYNVQLANLEFLLIKNISYEHTEKGLWYVKNGIHRVGRLDTLVIDENA